MRRKAIALVRVSTEGQADEERGGLEAQRVEIRRIAKAYDLDLLDWVELEGVSGAAVLSDPRFAELMRRLSDPEVHGVVVAAFDRLFRRGRYSDFAVLDYFADSGSVLYTSDGPRDLTSGGDGLLSVIQGELAGMERQKIRERTMRGKEVLRRAGHHVGGPQALPTAVQYAKGRDADGTVRPRWAYVWPDAERVRRAFELVLSGQRNLAEIGRQIDMDRGTLRKVLRNPIYMGIRRIDGRRRNGKRFQRIESEVIETKVIDLPLVDPADWQRVQQILDSRFRPAPKNRPNPCTYHGLTRCAVCGAGMSVRKDRRWGWHYRCRSSTVVGLGCHTGQLVYRAVDRAVDGAVRDVLGDADLLAEVISAAAEDDSSPDLARLDQEAAAKAIEQLEGERRLVPTSYERGLRTLSEAEQRVRELDQKIAMLEHVATQGTPPERDIETIALDIAETFASWDHLSLEDKRGILRPTVRSVRVSRAGIGKAVCNEIELFIPNPRAGLVANGAPS